jgi:dCTP deaminase
MSILSDKQIRARSLVPTHSYLPPNYRRMFLALHGDKIYNVATGELFAQGEDVQGWLSNKDVKELTASEQAGYCVLHPRMISPFEPELVRTRKVRRPMRDPALDSFEEEKIVSHGLSSYGYDVRCGTEFKIFTNVNSTIVDPKKFDDKSFVEFNGEECIIPPNSFALARTIEKFHIPRDILTVCLGKSTYARCGIIVNVTPFEPEWEGYVTLEFSNTTPLPAKIYANEGVAQVLFLKSDSICETSYADRGGKYQGQGAEPICPKV